MLHWLMASIVVLLVIGLVLALMSAQKPEVTFNYHGPNSGGGLLLVTLLLGAVSFWILVVAGWLGFAYLANERLADKVTVEGFAVAAVAMVACWYRIATVFELWFRYRSAEHRKRVELPVGGIRFRASAAVLCTGLILALLSPNIVVGGCFACVALSGVWGVVRFLK
jgi:hypothetical protein